MSDTTEKPAEKPTTFTCKVCGNEKPRKSMKGPVPQTCQDCKDAAKTEQFDRMRAADREIPPPPLPDDVQVEVAPPPVEESWLDDPAAQELLREKRQREVDTGVAYDPEVHGSVEDYLAAASVETSDYADVELAVNDLSPYAGMSNTGPDRNPAMQAAIREAAPERSSEDDISSPAAVCIVGPCGIADPPHVGLFCANHWQQVNLDHRSILLGSAVNSEPFVATARRVARNLT